MNSHGIDVLLAFTKLSVFHIRVSHSEEHRRKMVIAEENLEQYGQNHNTFVMFFLQFFLIISVS